MVISVGDRERVAEVIAELGAMLPRPVMTVERVRLCTHWFSIVDDVTADAGMVTSEIVPALRATAPNAHAGGLDLARPDS